MTHHHLQSRTFFWIFWDNIKVDFPASFVAKILLKCTFIKCLLPFTQQHCRFSAYILHSIPSTRHTQRSESTWDKGNFTSNKFNILQVMGYRQLIPFQKSLLALVKFKFVKSFFRQVYWTIVSFQIYRSLFRKVYVTLVLVQIL